MSARSRKEVLEQARQRYAKRGREGRSRLLNEVCELCGYERAFGESPVCRIAEDAAHCTVAASEPDKFRIFQNF
jgi:hypothetical protein